MMGVLVDLQKEWAVQILVLFSFSLQVFLLMFGWIRRRISSWVLRTLLWLAYQLADSVALFALGHLSMSSKLQEHRLVAFWAPFLLVHLGGQDTITAYAFEDNQLWLRHLQTLVVQVLGAAYVLYRYLPGGETLVLVAAMLMFVVGVLKYGERIWALQCACFESMSSSLERTPLEKPDVRDILHSDVRDRAHYVERYLQAAHYLLEICKGLFVGLTRSVQAGSIVLPDVNDTRAFVLDLPVLVEMELFLMYDVMYTKAAVIHTWYGCCIRVVSLAATAAAFVLFQLSSKEGHRRHDVAISYVLLAGALVLEMISLLRAIVSSWTCAILYARGWHRLHEVLLHLRGLVIAKGTSRWSGYVGQYSLFESCSRDTTEVAARMARSIGPAWLDNWWHKVHHSVYVSITGGTRIVMFYNIFRIMRLEQEAGAGWPRSQERFITTSYRPGQYTIRSYGFEQDIDGSNIGHDVGLEDSIIAWHVATTMLLRSSDVHIDAVYRHFTEAITVLSNYMMFLLVARPYMLPGPVRLSRHVQARDALYSLLLRQGDDGATAGERLERAVKMDSLSTGHLLQAPADGNETSAYGSGVALAERLLRAQRSQDSKLDFLFGVWVEMLRYVAAHCSRESHARQLSTGGEFLTIVWLMDAQVDVLVRTAP